MPPRPEPPLPALEDLLASGGDGRIIRDLHGMNKYGCFSVPQPDMLAYGSCTASTISASGFAAATRLYERLERAARQEASAVTYAREMTRLREAFAALHGLPPGVAIIFGASGTDLHLFAAQLLHKADKPLLVIMPDAAETGSGVPAALQGRHFSSRTALGGVVTMGDVVASHDNLEVAAINSRFDTGDLRPAALVDGETTARVERAIEAGRRVLLTLTDLSKTGLIIPSVACALSLKRRFPAMLDILVDACQFRLSPATLRAYLEQDFLLALTGSKFVGGPAFSGVLLAPERLRDRVLPPALALYSTRADWPSSWEARATLSDTANYGLLLRWEAALAECRAFHALPERDIRRFVECFAGGIRQRLSDDPVFEPLPIRKIDRSPLASTGTWDQLPTIFPFRMRHPESGALLDREAMTRIYALLRQDLHAPPLAARRCQLGQPVLGGALRLCLDMRLIVDALSPQGRGGEAVMADALRVLDKAALLASRNFISP